MKAPFLREYYPYEFAHGRPYRMYFCKEVSDQMKAVIMAGGEGSRLRPLTCDLPKPMARLCGRPIFEYILDLLLQNDFDEAAVTLRYLPNAITRRYGSDGKTGRYREMKLAFVEEEQPLGTAGGVKNAAKGFDEPFLVISGDALCDFDLSAAMRFHQERGAAATILVKQVEDPREYGLVNYKEDGTVTGFLEKPDWAQASTDTANTGIYLLNPEILDLIPDRESYDFAKNLFPKLLSMGQTVCAYPCSGYWCDIGDLDTFLACQRDILNGKVRCVMPSKEATGIYCAGALPQGDYEIIPPVYLGEGITVGDGAVIGPNTVIEDGCRIGRSAKVKRAVLLRDCYLGDRAACTGALLCANSSVKRGASVYEGAALGAGAVVGEGATVRPGVRIWPGKRVEEGAVAAVNLQFGTVRSGFFDDDGVSGETGVEMTPEFMARFGAAVGTVLKGKTAAVCGLPDECSKMMKRALISGIQSTGAGVLDFGELFESALRYGTQLCGAQMGVFVSGGLKTRLALCTGQGLPLPRSMERDLDACMQRGEFSRCAYEEIREAEPVPGVLEQYKLALKEYAPGGLSGMNAAVKSASPLAGRVLREVLFGLGCTVESGLQLHIGASGTRLAAADEETGYIWAEKVLTLCCWDEFQKGNDVALPYEAPRAIDHLAGREGRRVLRYLDCPTGACDKEARALAERQPWVRDGMMCAVKLLRMLKERKATLRELLDQIPGFSIAQKSIPWEGNPGRALKRLAGEGYRGDAAEGVLISTGKGKVLVRPAKRGKGFKILAEAANFETAMELCEGLQEAIFRQEAPKETPPLDL